MEDQCDAQALWSLSGSIIDPRTWKQNRAAVAARSDKSFFIIAHEHVESMLRRCVIAPIAIACGADAIFRRLSRLRRFGSLQRIAGFAIGQHDEFGRPLLDAATLAKLGIA